MQVNFKNDQFSLSEITRDEVEIMMSALADFKNKSLKQKNEDANSHQKEQIRLDKHLTHIMFRKIESCYIINLVDVEQVDVTPYAEEIHR